MLKRFSPHSIVLDGDIDEEFWENDTVCTLDHYQAVVETDEQMKEYCYPLFEQGAKEKNMSIDEYYDYLVKKYPYREEFSRWYRATDEEIAKCRKLYSEPMKRG